jgi:hypothetical protein
MRLGLINGIHEDIIRLEAAVELLEKQGCEAIACLGDLVGYSVPYYGFLASRNAHRVIELVRETCAYVVAGNHDLFAVRRLPRQQAIFDYPADWYSLDFFTRQALAQGRVFLYDDELPAHLTPEDEAYLAGLPEYLAVEADGLKLLLSHYAYPDLTGNSPLFDPAEAGQIDQHLAFMARHGCWLGLSGHDLVDGFRLLTATSVQELPFGPHVLPDEPAWLHGPWVAHGTQPNGVMFLDTTTRQITALPLHSPRHVVPVWRNL